MPPPPPSAPTDDHRPNYGRRPLAPKNPPAITAPGNPLPTKQSAIHHNRISNKENNINPPIHDPVSKTQPPMDTQPFDSSLAEELKTVRAKMERQRADKVKTEKMLKQRLRFLDLHMDEVSKRGELQNHLEMEVDRLYRLKEIKLACLRVSPIRSLREKEEEKKMKNTAAITGVTASDECSGS